MDLGVEDTPTKGLIQQQGSGAYTLCSKCNNNTGAWYVSDFARWCRQAMNVLTRSGCEEHQSIYFQDIYPIRILKEVVTMFFSINYTMHEVQPDLVRFVLDKERTTLPPKFRFFVYLTRSPRCRYVNVVGLLKLDSPHKTHLVSEINRPPLGYVMTIDSPAPDNRLFEITHFAHYHYDDRKTMTLKLPMLEVYTAIPGDYRTKQEIVDQQRASLEMMAKWSGLKR
jgi:hypothetical protein